MMVSKMQGDFSTLRIKKCMLNIRKCTNYYTISS